MTDALNELVRFAVPGIGGNQPADLGQHGFNHPVAPLCFIDMEEAGGLLIMPHGLFARLLAECRIASTPMAFAFEVDQASLPRCRRPA